MGSSKPSLGSWVENFVFSVHALMWYILGDGGQASPHWAVGQKTLYSLCMPLCSIYWGMGVKQALTGQLGRKLCILCACPYVVYIGGWGSSKPSLGSWVENFGLCACPYVVYIGGWGSSKPSLGSWVENFVFSVHALMWYILGDGGQASPHWGVGQKTLYSLCMPLCGIYWGMGVKQALTGELVRKLCILCACPYVVYIGGWGSSKPSLGSWSENFVFSVHALMWYILGDGGQASPHWGVGQKTLYSLCMPLCGIYWGMGSSKPSLGSWSENFVFSVHALMWYILGDGVKQALTGQLGRKLCVLCACPYVVYIGGWGQASPHWAVGQKTLYSLCMPLCGIYWGMGSSKPSLGSWSENFVFSVHALMWYILGDGVKQALTGELGRKLCVLCACTYVVYIGGWGSSKPSLGSWSENFVFSVHALMWYILGDGVKQALTGELVRKLCVLCACPYVVYIGGWGQASPHWGVGQKTLCSLCMHLCVYILGDRGSSKPSLGSWSENFVFSVHALMWYILGVGSSKPSLGSWAENFVFSVHALMWYILGDGVKQALTGELGRKLCVLCACPYVVYIGGWGQASPHWAVGQKTLCSLCMPLCGIYWGMGVKQALTGQLGRKLCILCACPYVVYIGGWGQASPHWAVGWKTLCSLCMPLCGIYWGMGVKQALTGQLGRKLCVLCACPYIGGGSSKPSLGRWVVKQALTVQFLT